MPARTSSFLGALLVATAGFAGCTSGGSSSPSPSVTATTSTTGTTPTTVVAGPELTGNGAEPRVPLRLHLTSDTRQDVEITTDLGVTETGVGGPQTIDPPPVTQTIRIRVGTVDADGSAKVSFEVTGAVVGRGNALTEAEVLTYTAALAGLRGIRGAGRLSARGQFGDVELSVPAEAGPSVRSQVTTLRAQIAQLSPLLPSDPVGVGAAWTSTSTASIGGATVTQMVTTRITAITGDKVAYRSTTSSIAARQPLPLAALPAGTTATLASSDLAGTGRGIIDLTAVVSASSTEATGTQVIELQTNDGPPSSTTQRLIVTTRSEPRP